MWKAWQSLSSRVTFFKVAAVAFLFCWPFWALAGTNLVAGQKLSALGGKTPVQPTIGNIGGSLLVLSPLAAFFLAWLLIARTATPSRRRLIFLVAMFLGALGTYLGCCLLDWGFPRAG